MGLFSFGSKDDASPPRAASGARAGHARRGARRAEQRSDPDAMRLDPTLPEKQRARRRLVGAIALVVAAVVVLPMILDSHPKPVTDGIAIDIPARPERALALSPAHDDAATLAGASVNPPPAAVSANGIVKPAAGSSGAQSRMNTRVSTASVVPNTPAGNRYVVQLGALDNDSAARGWVDRLKALGVPAYVERRRQPDGSERVLLRAGPFADRSAAAAAVTKVREAGLTAGGDAKRAP